MGYGIDEDTHEQSSYPTLLSDDVLIGEGEEISGEAFKRLLKEMEDTEHCESSSVFSTPPLTFL